MLLTHKAGLSDKSIALTDHFQPVSRPRLTLGIEVVEQPQGGLGLARQRAVLGQFGEALAGLGTDQVQAQRLPLRRSRLYVPHVGWSDLVGELDAGRAARYKATDTNGTFAAWVPQQPLFEENVDGIAAHIGDWIFLVGGSKGDGTPVATVQQGLVAGTVEDPNAILEPWRVSAQTNLPSARTNASGFTANGVLYIQGGSDGTAPITQTLWTTPDAGGVIPEWHTLAQTDLGVGLEGAAGVVSGSHAFVVGGDTAEGPTAGLARANLAPQEPFFQLGLMGVVVPALQLQGETGQQIGYLNAATVGAVNFIALIIVGWAFNHQERVREIVAALRERRRKR